MQLLKVRTRLSRGSTLYVKLQLIGMAASVLFDDALEQAKALDEEFETTGRVRGPLHGVPFSVKDLCKRGLA